ncbi:MAG: DUF177 domain-containing protein [Rikenellaceae bacterium]|nr:DUF177 domain-containing protein [Rikenellaceae bacterium]
MGQLNDYKIAFRGLKNGTHTFEIAIDDKLFEAFENADVQGGTGRAEVAMDRSETQLVCDVKIEADVVVPCDRCLEPCHLPIRYEGRLVVKFSEEELEYDGEVLWLFPGESEVDLSHYIYESIILALPYQRVHAEGDCDPTMLARFTIGTEAELEAIEERAAHEEEGKKSEWDKLAALKAQMEQKD